MLHVPSMEGLDGSGRRAYKPDDPMTDDSDLLLLTALSVLEATGCLQAPQDDNLPGRATSADLHFAFVLAFCGVRSWFTDCGMNWQPATMSVHSLSGPRERRLPRVRPASLPVQMRRCCSRRKARVGCRRKAFGPARVGAWTVAMRGGRQRRRPKRDSALLVTMDLAAA